MLCIVTDAVQNVLRNDHAYVRVYDAGTCRLHYWRKINLEFKKRGRHEPNCNIIFIVMS